MTFNIVTVTYSIATVASPLTTGAVGSVVSVTEFNASVSAGMRASFDDDSDSLGSVCDPVRPLEGLRSALRGPGWDLGIISATVSWTCMWYLYVFSVLAIVPGNTQHDVEIRQNF